VDIHASQSVSSISLAMEKMIRCTLQNETTPADWPAHSKADWLGFETTGMGIFSKVILEDRVDVAKALLVHAPGLARPQGPISAPLIEAALVGSLDMVTLLLESGADPTVRNRRDLTAWGEAMLAQPHLLPVLSKTLSDTRKNAEWPLLFHRACALQTMGHDKQAVFDRLLAHCPVLPAEDWAPIVQMVLLNQREWALDGHDNGWSVLDALVKSLGADLDVAIPEGSFLEFMVRQEYWSEALGLIGRGVKLPEDALRVELFGRPLIRRMSKPRDQEEVAGVALLDILDALEKRGMDLLRKDPAFGMTPMALTRPGKNPARWAVSCWLAARGQMPTDEQGNEVSLVTLAQTPGEQALVVEAVNRLLSNRLAGPEQARDSRKPGRL
jgi:hypothetical protein